MRRLLPLLLLAPMLTAAKCKRHPDKDPDETIDVVDTITKPDVELQVVSIDPDRVDPDKGFGGTVFGAGFEKGSRVFLGERELDHVSFKTENDLDIGVPGLPVGRYDVRVQNPNGDRSVLRGGLIVAGSTTSSACSTIRVSFRLDSALLDAPEQANLKAKLSCFEGGSGAVRIEGHCDERGTTEYNLALGTRRAAAVERFLESQGVPPSRLRSVSYGEERPLASGHDETAYSQNRRADIVIQD